MGDRLRYTTTIVVSIEVLAGAFLELVSALAKAIPLVTDRIVEMCRKCVYLQGEIPCLRLSVHLAEVCIRMHWDKQDKVLRSPPEFCLFPIAEW